MGALGGEGDEGGRGGGSELCWVGGVVLGASFAGLGWTGLAAWLLRALRSVGFLACSVLVLVFLLSPAISLSSLGWALTFPNQRGWSISYCSSLFLFAARGPPAIRHYWCVAWDCGLLLFGVCALGKNWEVSAFSSFFFSFFFPPVAPRAKRARSYLYSALHYLLLGWDGAAENTG